MEILPKSVKKLIESFTELPGIGEKTAERLTFFLLKSEAEKSEKLAQALLNLKKETKICSLCFNISETDPCSICSNPQRDKTIICVVEEPLDAVAIEKTNSFKGVYHILGGAISPIEGIEAEDLNIKQLKQRIENSKEKVKEVILATNPNLEGEATAIYIAKLLKPLGVKVSRIAYGLPTGANLEFADEITLQKALEGRKEY